jgi:PIN domain nuclease of toxin-antitoxin system
MGTALRLLLDTHTLIWWAYDGPQLSRTARDAIDDPTSEVFVSAVSAFEIGTKFGQGKLPDAAYLADNLITYVREQNFKTLPISLVAGLCSGRLPRLHKDPFDRMLIAQAIEADLTLVSNEEVFDDYGVNRLW